MTREELNAVIGYVSNIQTIKNAYITEHLPINYGTICAITANGWKLIEKLKKQEPCEDAISRQVVLDMLEDINAETEGVGFYYEHYVEYIKNLPPANPQPKTGRWIIDDITKRSKSEYKHKCDRCGAYHRAMYNYCPSCGAKMEVEV